MRYPAIAKARDSGWNLSREAQTFVECVKKRRVIVETNWLIMIVTRKRAEVERQVQL
jgi:hypothetical protein